MQDQCSKIILDEVIIRQCNLVVRNTFADEKKEV